MKNTVSRRIESLDFLRGIAIVLVLFRHHDFLPFLQRIGWVGVDLFFVLSGFLVSRLIYQEFLMTGTFSAQRFLIRRGLRIYPAFYMFLLISLLFFGVAYFAFGYAKPDILLKAFSEAFFLQNYIPGLWGHTWSLAVEEHFYVSLCLVLWLAAKQGAWAMKRSVWLGVALVVIVPVLRWMNVQNNPGDYFDRAFYTHHRIDAMAWGALIGFGFSYYHNDLKRVLAKPLFLLPIFLLGTMLLTWALSASLHSIFMVTWGFSIISLGFVCWIMVVLLANDQWLSTPLSWAPLRFIRYVGVHSYAIYLFHMFFPSIFDNLSLTTQFPISLLFGVYVLGSFVVGIAVSHTIERWALAFRDKKFPRLVDAK